MLKTRLWMGTLIAAIAAGVIVFDHWLPPWYPFLFLMAVGVGTTVSREVILLSPESSRPSQPLILSLVCLLFAANWIQDGPAHVWQILGLAFVFITLLLFLVETARYEKPTGHSLPRTALGVFTIAYVGGTGSCLLQLRWEAGEVVTAGVYWSLPIGMIFFVPKLGDVAAYFSGRALGRTPFSPKLSPKKTWEGSVGGALGAIAVTALMVYAGHGPVTDWAKTLCLGACLAVVGQLGDLAASMLKRDSGVKDAAKTIPGFGGMLDVVDSVLIVAPVVYFWWVFVGVT